MPAPDLPVLSAQQPIAAAARPTSAFLLFMEKTRKAIIAAFTAQDAIDVRQDQTDLDLAQAIADIVTAQAAADAADAKAVVADDKAEAAQTDADTALLDAANAQTDADAATILAADASNDAATALLAIDGIVDGSVPLDAGVIGTLQIASNAINLSGYHLTPGTIALSTSPTVVESLTLTTNGGAVAINGGALISGTHSVRFSVGFAIRRDGVNIWGPYYIADSYLVATGVLAIFSMAAVPTIQDIPSATSHTYDITAQLSPGSTATGVTAESRTIWCNNMRDAV